MIELVSVAEEYLQKRSLALQAPQTQPAQAKREEIAQLRRAIARPGGNALIPQDK